LPSQPNLLEKKIKFRDTKPILPTTNLEKRDGSSSLRRGSQILVAPKVNLNRSLKPRHSVLLQPNQSFDFGSGAEKQILATKEE
jgi:hypothetical protein